MSSYHGDVLRHSKLILPTQKEKSSQAEAISHDLSLRAGLIRQVSTGIYDILPIGQRVISKIESIVRENMNRAGAQEISMPFVQVSDLWIESGRWSVYGKEMLRFTNREGREFCLGPTHEEVVSEIARAYLQSYKQLPFNLYQIGRKFRDEMRPKNGYLRSREFIMKDAYSFDADAEGLNKSYNAMKEAYIAIFQAMDLKAYPVIADTGEIGGSHSEEFMLPASIGEDKITLKGDTADKALGEEGITAIELGHIFKLNDTYSKKMGVVFMDAQGKKQHAMMGCYGIGITRLLNAIIEIHHDEKGITWPSSVSPFQVAIIPMDSTPKITELSERIYHGFLQKGVEVLLFDKQTSPGVKLNDANLIGIPYKVIIGQRGLASGKIEIEDRKTMVKTESRIDDVISTYFSIKNR